MYFKSSSSPLFVSLSVLSCPCVPVSPIPVSLSCVPGCYFVLILDLYFAVGFHFVFAFMFGLCILCVMDLDSQLLLLKDAFCVATCLHVCQRLGPMC